MKITIAQLIVGRDIAANQQRMESVLEYAGPDDWVVFPEGVLSGYFPDDDTFLQGLDPVRIESGISAIESLVRTRNCNCIFGTATFADNAWRNSVVAITSDGQRHIYHKIELSTLDRLRFEPGTKSEAIRNGEVTFGILACRELLFPGMWSKLKQTGTQVVFHINNAIQPHDRIWDHIFITRAIEQSFFVCSVNNGSPPQQLASCLVAPTGKVLVKTISGSDDVVSAEIEPCEAIADLESRTDF